MANNAPFKPNSSLEINGPIEFFKGTVTESNTTFDITKDFIFKAQKSIMEETNAFDITGAGSALDIFFKPDGTAFFIISYDDIKKWDLSTAWDISTATYNHSESISGIGTSTNYRCLTFSPDGLRLFIIENSGSSTKQIHEFTLSVAWDLGSTVTDTGDILSVPNTNGSGLTSKSINFNDDGSKLFVYPDRLAPNSDRIYSFNLTTNYSLSTSAGAITSNIEINNATSYILPIAGNFRFNSDGTKLFISHTSSASQVAQIKSFDLSTPYDIAGAGIESGASPAVPDQSLIYTTIGYQTFPHSFFFKDDGKKIYFLNYGSVAEYDIGGKQINLDLSTGNYFEVNLDADSDLIFDNARYVDLFSVKVNGVSTEGHGTVPGNFSTSSNLNSLISFGTPWGMDLVDNGTKLYLYDFADEQVKYISLSTPYDVSSGSFSYQSFTSVTGSGTSNFRSLTVRDSGTKMHLTTGTTVHQWTLNTAYSLGSTTYNGSITPTGGDAGWNIFWNNDGTRLYSSSSTGTILQMDLSTAYDITSTVTDNGTSPTIPSKILYGMDLDETGTYFYYVESSNSNQIIYRATLSTPYDITTLDWNTEVEIDLTTLTNPSMPSSSNKTAVRIVDEGRKVAMLDNSYDVVRVFTLLQTPYITLSPNVDVLGTQTSVINESSARYTFSTKNNGTKFIGAQTGTDFS